MKKGTRIDLRNRRWKNIWKHYEFLIQQKNVKYNEILTLFNLTYKVVIYLL